MWYNSGMELAKNVLFGIFVFLFGAIYAIAIVYLIMLAIHEPL